jgi:hypothetical protein
MDPACCTPPAQSPAVFDRVKLSWMNGQHLRALPEEELLGRIGAALVADGVVTSPDSAFAKALAGLVKGSVELLTDCAAQVSVCVCSRVCRYVCVCVCVFACVLYFCCVRAGGD